MRLLKLILSLSVCCSALLGDAIVFESKYSSSSHVFRALADSAVHATIGFFSSLVFFSHDINEELWPTFGCIIFCTLLSSLIDVDHAVTARSINIKDMTSLPNRPILHCTSLWILFSSILFFYTYMAKKINLFILTFMVVIAFASHHIRDANRRGLWMYPFGHTPAIPKYIYVGLLGLLPNFCALTAKSLEPRLSKYSVLGELKDLV